MTSLQVTQTLRLIKLRAKLMQLAEDWEASAAESTRRTLLDHPDDPEARATCERLETLAGMCAAHLRALVESELP